MKKNYGPHPIWSNFIHELMEEEKYVREEHPELTDEQVESVAYELLYQHLDDERVNLNIRLSTPILVIADIGRWNGRVSGYKEISSGNIRDCLYDECDYTNWYVDELGDLRCEAIHHDGRNHYLYRAYKENVTAGQIEALKEKIYTGIVTRSDITRVTKRLGGYIADVYGFNVPRHKVVTL